MKEFVKDHPYLTAFLAIVLVGGLFYTIRFVAAANMLKKQGEQEPIAVPENGSGISWQNFIARNTQVGTKDLTKDPLKK